MVKKKIQRKKSGQASKKSRRQQELNFDVKVGILHTIAEAIYSTRGGKIREAVANARDNEASWIIIIVDQTMRSLHLFDNGTGISEKRFHEIFKSIGYGLLRNADDKKLSYFGLGLMSIFQLGKKVKMFSRPCGEKQIYKLEVDTASIFSEGNEDNSISSLKTFISLHESDESEMSSASTTLLSQSLKENPFKHNLNSFTEIIIEDIRLEDMEAICDDDFVKELRKILPLRPEKDEPFLKRLTGEKAKDVKKIMQNEEFCKTIDVYFGIEEDNTLEQLWKYFPAFRADLTFPDDNIYVGESQSKNFAYYIMHSVAVDLHRSHEVERESGFWVRNQNFLVKSADFLERPGPGRKLKPISEPL